MIVLHECWYWNLPIIHTYRFNKFCKMWDSYDGRSWRQLNTYQQRRQKTVMDRQAFVGPYLEEHASLSHVFNGLWVSTHAGRKESSNFLAELHGFTSRHLVDRHLTDPPRIFHGSVTTSRDPRPQKVHTILHTATRLRFIRPAEQKCMANTSAIYLEVWINT